jgi:hypothetical protein
MAPGTQQVIQSKSYKMYQSQQQQPPHVLLSILETKKKDGRQVETQTMEQSSEQESLQLEALSSSWSKSGKKRRGVVRMRLARFGRKKAPFYRIRVADSRAPRDGRFLERIGYYDPKPGMYRCLNPFSVSDGLVFALETMTPNLVCIDT